MMINLTELALELHTCPAIPSVTFLLVLTTQQGTEEIRGLMTNARVILAVKHTRWMVRATDLQSFSDSSTDQSEQLL